MYFVGMYRMLYVLAALWHNNDYCFVVQTVLKSKPENFTVIVPWYWIA